MAEIVKLNPEKLEQLRTMNPRLISYNVEMTEVTGGTFWKAYTDAQIDGTEQVPPSGFFQGPGRHAPVVRSHRHQKSPSDSSGQSAGQLLGPRVRHLGHPYLL